MEDSPPVPPIDANDGCHGGEKAPTLHNLWNVLKAHRVDKAWKVQGANRGGLPVANPRRKRELSVEPQWDSSCITTIAARPPRRKERRHSRLT